MRLALFFTTGVALKTWENLGNLDRELKSYIELSTYFEEILFFTYGTKEDLVFQNYLPKNITILPKRFPIPNKLYSFLLPWFYRKQLKKVDVYKTNQMSGAWAALIAARLYKKKLVVRCGYELLRFLELEKVSRLKRSVISFLERLVYQKSNAIIVTSSSDREYIIKKFSIDKEKINIIPNYIDTELFKPMPSVQKQKNRIIFVGRLHKQKNLPNLLHALVGLECSLLIVGSGELKPTLVRLAEELQVSVEFKDRIANKELPYELNQAEVFILPSLFEGNPKTLLEAMSTGLPCIGTDVEGIANIIDPHQNGLLCGTDTPSLHQALKELLVNKELQEILGASARKTIVEGFSLDEYLNKEKQVYSKL